MRREVVPLPLRLYDYDVAEFETSEDGRTHEASVRESAHRLHKLFPELDPLIFEAFLTTGRTWNVLQSLGAKHWAVLGLTGHQLSTLRFLLLADDGRLTIGDIASRLATSSTNVTKLVNRMERSGFVERITDQTDRRITWVVLTPIGRDRYIATMPSSQLDRDAFGVLSEEEQRTLIDLLARVRRKTLELLAAQGQGVMDSEDD
jgi:MarR family 2-MHQ and catechol resistance regulon transcriptional repressor